MAKIMMGFVALWMLLATAIVTYILWKKDRMHTSSAIILPILTLYFSFVLTITILERGPSQGLQYKLVRFWSYKEILVGKASLISENFWNIVLFMPIGVFISGLLNTIENGWL